jgi:hypothetical protein
MATSTAATTTAPAQEAFRIIYPTVIFSDPSGIDPMLGSRFGTVASVPGKGTVARSLGRGVNGDILYSYREWRENEHEEPTWGCRGDDELSIFSRTLEEARARPRIGRLEATPDELEFARFAAAWPGVAKRIGLIASRPAQVFAPGDAWRPVVFDPDLGDWPDYQQFLDRHAAGDWGTVGRHDPSPLNEADGFMVGMLSRARRNSHTLLKRCGLVLSIYPLPTAKKPLVLMVVTAMFPSQAPITLLLPRPENHLPFK